MPSDGLPLMDGSGVVPKTHGRMTVAALRHALDALDPASIVVIGCGPGYEEPKVAQASVRACLVPQRYLSDRDGIEVVVLRPVNG